jgi:hypothetical protein
MLKGSTLSRLKSPKITFSQLMYFEVHSLILISQLLESVCGQSQSDLDKWRPLYFLFKGGLVAFFSLG